MLKRLLDIFVSLFGLLIFSPVLLPVMFAIFWQDRHSPFYIASRVGKDGQLFRMVKLRSMVANADTSGVDSTSSGDMRITRVGHFIRKYKLDELMQLWNVLKGEMSLVGPRPNVERDVAIYTSVERRLLGIKPGITDISSIVFSDEGDILKNSVDPDLDYNQRIRPWKSRLGLIYIDNHSILLDIRLIFLTCQAILSKKKALHHIGNLLRGFGVEPEVVKVARREVDLKPYPPPGSSEIVDHR